MKLAVSVVPTQTPSSLAPASSLPHPDPPAASHGQPGSPLATSEAIIFDGKTFTVTFSQISGKLLPFLSAIVQLCVTQVQHVALEECVKNCRLLL